MQFIMSMRHYLPAQDPINCENKKIITKTKLIHIMYFSYVKSTFALK